MLNRWRRVFVVPIGHMFTMPSNLENGVSMRGVYRWGPLRKELNPVILQYSWLAEQHCFLALHTQARLPKSEGRVRRWQLSNLRVAVAPASENSQPQADTIMLASAPVICWCRRLIWGQMSGLRILSLSSTPRPPRRVKTVLIGDFMLEPTLISPRAYSGTPTRQKQHGITSLGLAFRRGDHLDTTVDLSLQDGSWMQFNFTADLNPMFYAPISELDYCRMQSAFSSLHWQQMMRLKDMIPNFWFR